MELLLLPRSLSADWSFNCIPLIESLNDPRLLAVALLYGAALAWGLYLLYHWHDTWSRVYIFYTGFMVASFLPASNVFFFVGTMMAERLLYLPSIGFCFLLSSGTIAIAGHAAKLIRRRAKIRRLRPQSELSIAYNWIFIFSLTSLLAPLLVFYSLRTLSHNAAWSSEEALFTAAADVCPDSAKVQENVGVLERRRANWAQALWHFHRAKEIDPGFCEVEHWLGLTYLNAGDLERALLHLKEGLRCIWVYAKCFELLRHVFDTLIAQDPKYLRQWEEVLELALLYHPHEAPAVYENLALLYYSQNDSVGAVGALAKAYQAESDPKGRCRLASSVAALCKDGPFSCPTSPGCPQHDAVQCALTLEQLIDCSPDEGQAATLNAYMLWLHTRLHENSSSPDLQRLWAELLVRIGRGSESAAHYQASIQLYMERHLYSAAYPLAKRAVDVNPASCELNLLIGFLHAVYRSYGNAKEHLAHATATSCPEETRALALAKIAEVSALGSD